DVDAAAWYFRAHFFQDPVQPGSLGLEAMIQLLQYHLIERAAGSALERPRFVSGTGPRLEWTYRGQVVPESRRVTFEVDVLEADVGPRESRVLGEGRLWVDGLQIYRASGLEVKVVEEADNAEDIEDPTGSTALSGETLDPSVDTWLADHSPLWAIPALPLMSMADRLAAAVQTRAGRPVTRLAGLRVRRWLHVPGPVRLRTRVTPQGTGAGATSYDAELLAWRDMDDPALSRYEPVASGRVSTGAPGPAPRRFAPLDGAGPAPDPYASAEMFHGPSMRYLTSLRVGDAGASATLEAGRGGVPRGALHQGLLDAATHAVPDLRRWNPGQTRQVAWFPHELVSMTVHEALPDTGEVDVEVRYGGAAAGRARVDVQMCRDERVLIAFRLDYVAVSVGRLGEWPRPVARAFLRDRQYVGRTCLSRADGDDTVLSRGDVERTDSIPGVVVEVFGLPDGARARDWLVTLAAKEHVAAKEKAHPCEIEVDQESCRAWVRYRPGEKHRFTVHREGETVRISNETANENES
ncbi:hypothetical protein E1264_40605, partial [Actinomadura sp. KC216]|uniref:polyketide synthase dehydratase domain-containing protein n=1 Tax=Actinomadura sp. KC216 TaxID=2530370 RepID=UPI0010EAC146